MADDASTGSPRPPGSAPHADGPTHQPRPTGLLASEQTPFAVFPSVVSRFEEDHRDNIFRDVILTSTLPQNCMAA